MQRLDMPEDREGGASGNCSRQPSARLLAMREHAPSARADAIKSAVGEPTGRIISSFYIICISLSLSRQWKHIERACLSVLYIA